MKNKNIFYKILTLGPIGYLPAPGTIATILTGLLIWVIKPQGIYYSVFAFVLFVLTLNPFTKCKKLLEDSDPPEVVMDEVWGTIITFAGILISIKSIILGIVIFRFFDISKIWPINRCEKRKGINGVLMDDVVAGLLANLVLRLCLIWI